MGDRQTHFLKLLKLYAFYAKMDAAWFLRDTTFCILAICADFIANIAAVAGVFLLAWKFDGVGGMSKFEVLFMLGYITVVTGVYQIFFANGNTGHISRRIGRGQIEHMLIQPLPLPVQLITEGFIPVSGSSNLISGGIIIAAALTKLGLTPDWWWIVTLIVNILITISILLALSYLVSTAAFYAPVQTEEIAGSIIASNGGGGLSMYSLSVYPLSGLSTTLQIPLITLLPAGLFGWFPSLALLGKPPLQLPSCYPVLVASVLILCTTILFRKGLRYYVKTGSNRYSSVGHRR